jgi:predicted metal-dependent HD superfamily phosphohydrolase
MDLDNIAHRWSPLLDDLPDLLPELARRYSEPHRAYHGVDHITALARLYVEVERGPTWHAPIEVALAILFHDAIYEPGRPDNEERSADLAIEMLRGGPLAKASPGGPPARGGDEAQKPAVDVARVAAMIRATKSHGDPAHAHDHDLAHFIDADMAIIGTAPDVYDAYAQAVRREFSNVPTPLFVQGRGAFLAAQLARPSLFHTPWFRARYEDAARANLARELATLTASGS